MEILAIIFFCILAIVACVRLFLIIKELKRISNELRNMNENGSESRLNVNGYDKHIDELSAQINKRLDLNAKVQKESRLMEYNLRGEMQNISHDLRTPLTSILGFLQLLKKGELDKNAQTEYLNVIEYRAKSLQALIDSLFEYSTISSVTFSLTLEQVDLNKLLTETLTNYYDSFLERNITPELTIPDDHIIISGAASAVRRVIENLIANALKYSTGRVVVSLEKDDRFAVLKMENPVDSVTDQEVSHIFERFYTADQSRTRGNSGLGLAIVKELMDKMGGHINVELNDGNMRFSCRWNLSLK